MKFRKYIVRAMALTISSVMFLSAGGCGLFSGKTVNDIISDVADMGNGIANQTLPSQVQTGEEAAEGETGTASGAVTALARKLLIGTFTEKSAKNVEAAVTEPGVTSIDAAVNGNAFYYSDDQKSKLLKNGFVVSDNGDKEFYKLYEMNRYANVANFVTVDSMMHAYHMYFAHLLKNTERTYLSEELLELSQSMLDASREQYSNLLGTEWEAAARRNVEFFTVGTALQNENVEIDGYAADVVNSELDAVINASGVGTSLLTGTFIDYSQFKPRGYYEGDAGLEKYFRAMMWYGQIGFIHKDEELDRSAMLINMALNEGSIDIWEEIYSVTSFFAGASDDLTFYEIMPAIWEAYGRDVSIDTIAGDKTCWESFRSYLDLMPVPAINSIPVLDDENPNTHANVENKGFRFMGQRFSIDEAIFQQLIYDYVGEDSEGARRMLPDTLDVAAALGSDVALEILEEQGDTDYAGYSDNMDSLKNGVENAGEELWTASLYSAWIYTLKPLLEEKGDGYPEFMKSEEWAKKDVESFAGSYTELKHDTVLYAKQAMAEMGGADIPSWDDRGYVEPEVEVWARFAALAENTAEGLQANGIISEDDVYNLYVMADLAEQFMQISEKELRGELLTDEEYDLIRYYGGDLEHLWRAALADEGDNINVTNFPAALVTDIATDPNGSCLEVGTGNPSEINVMVYFDGAYHICSGGVYTFYQFKWPLSDRLTDSAWRQMMGLEQTADGSYSYDTKMDHPAWTESYRYIR